MRYLSVRLLVGIAIALLWCATMAESKDRPGVFGRVIDENGKAVANPEVVLVKRDRWAKGPLDLTYETKTGDAQGSFRFDSGDFVEAWILARYKPAKSRYFYYTESKPFGPGQTDSSKKVEFVKSSPEVKGKLLDECGTPVVGAIVAVCPPPGHCFTTPRLMRWQGERAASNLMYLAQKYLPAAVTDAKGQFAISGFPSGTYSLLAASDGFNVLERPPSHLREGQLVNETLRMRTASQPGQICLAGKVLDQDGKPAGGLPVSARDAQGAEKRIVWTQSDGRFMIPNLPAGSWTLIVKSPGGMDGAELAKSAVEKATNTNVTLPVQLHSISGDVVLPDGAPAKQADIEVQTSFWCEPRTFKARNGKFELGQLPPGDLTLSAMVGGFRESVRTLDPRKTKKVVLQVVPQSALSVKVTDQNGEALPNVGIEISEMINGFMRTRSAGYTLADGTFTDNRVRPGRIEVLARNPGSKHGKATLDIVPGAQIEPLTFALDRSCRVEGEIIDATGKAVDAEFVLEAWPVSRFFGIEYDSSQGCIKSFPARQKTSIKLPPGEYDLRATVKLSPARYSTLSQRRLLFGQPPLDVLTKSQRLNLLPKQTRYIRLSISL